MRNLFRRPLVLGVPFVGLLGLAFAVLTLMIALGSSSAANLVTSLVALGGYIVLRLCTRFMTGGWEIELFYPIEKKFRKSAVIPLITRMPADLDIISPDTYENEDLIIEKEKISSQLWDLKLGTDRIFEFSVTSSGTRVQKLICGGAPIKEGTVPRFEDKLTQHQFVYSLTAVPIATTPLTMFEVLSRIEPPYKVLIRVSGLAFNDAKKRVEGSRKRNSGSLSAISDIDSDVSFEESSRVLEMMSRGEESLAEVSFTILSHHALPLDLSVFHLEKNTELAIFSMLGFRRSHFRGHVLRITTISDLFPNFMDPHIKELSVLSTLRNNPLYFSPQDGRLEALHWLVVGATGTGKSFFTGAVLNRLIDSGLCMSVLFVDHNRSFKRAVSSRKGAYFEPQTLDDLKTNLHPILQGVESPGSVSGIELSDLHFEEKKSAAFHLLASVEDFLRKRSTHHVVYIVLDECWNFLRDEPVLVQRAFREFRKLNGAVIAITQSLSDFLSDVSGRSIIQNAPLRILLRQGEDVSAYRGTLGLNEIEIKRLRLLKQKKGVFSECLIKTSFSSNLARLYPSPEEFELLRTDNLRETRQQGGTANAQ